MDRSRFRIDDPTTRARLANRSQSSGYVQRPVGYSRVIDINAPLPSTPQQSPIQVSPIEQSQSVERPFVAQTQQATQNPVEPSNFTQPDDVVAEQHLPIQPEEPFTKKRKSKSSIALYGMATMLLIVGLAVSINGFIVNRHVSATVAHLNKASASSIDDESAPPSTVKPSAADISAYVVAPNMARYISIPKIDVQARVLSMGVTSSNQLRAPRNVYDTGWYNGSSLPGQPGAMLVDGHVSSWTTQGVFYGLNKLVVGDEITITKGDGQKLVYQVVKAEIKESNSVDMALLLVSQDTAKPGLNLISCSGDVIPGTNEFDKRIIVYATLKS